MPFGETISRGPRWVSAAPPVRRVSVTGAAAETRVRHRGLGAAGRPAGCPGSARGWRSSTRRRRWTLRQLVPLGSGHGVEAADPFWSGMVVASVMGRSCRRDAAADAMLYKRALATANDGG